MAPLLLKKHRQKFLATRSLLSAVLLPTVG